MKETYDDIDEFIRDLKASIADSNGECAAHHYNLGMALLSKRDFEGAEASFRDALRESPHMAEAMVQLGGICMNRGDLEGCLRYNTDATNCRPKFAIAESNIAFVYLQLRQPDKALPHVEKALRWDPDYTQALSVRGTANLMLGKYEECEKDCRAVLKAEPSFAPAWNNLAVCFAQQDRWTDAADAVKKAEELGYDVPEGLKKEIADKTNA